MKKPLTPEEQMTDEQTDSMVTLILGSTRKSATSALRQLRNSGELSKKEFQTAIRNARQLPSRLIPHLKVMIKEMARPQVLQWTSDLLIPAQPRFVVAEKFTKSNPDVMFWGFGPNFVVWHMPLIEWKVGETEVSMYKLRIPANHSEMTPELSERRLVTASQLYWMLEQQPNGEKPNGKNRRLKTDGSANFLRIPDTNEIERAVSVCWLGGFGWYVNADGLEYQDRWCAGNRVVSCK